MAAWLDERDMKNLKALLFKLYEYEISEQAVVDFHMSTAKLKVISCPARTSKSYAGWKDALPDVFAPGIALAKGASTVESMLGWIVAPNYDLAKEFDYAWADLFEKRAKLGLDYRIGKKANSPKQGNMTLELLWGHDSRGQVVRSLIEVKSAFNEKSLQSEEVDVCIMSEAARLPQIVWTKYLSTRVGRSIWPTTPDVQAVWIWEMLEDAARHPELGVEHFQFTGRANPRYNWTRFWTEHAKAESLVDGLIETTPRNRKHPPASANGHDCFDELAGCKAMKWDDFAEQFGGRWVFHRGRVVPLREHDSAAGAPAHVIDYDFDWMPGAFWSIACDYGYDHAAVVGFWATGPGQVHVLRDCIYQNHLTPDELTDRTMEKWAQLRERFEIERMMPHRFVGDPKKPEVEAVFRRRGLPIWNVDKKAQASRLAGHQELMSCLAIDPATGMPGLFVHAVCDPIIKEWRTLRRNDRVRAEDSPTSFIGDDHGYDMARYFVMARPRALDFVPSPDSFETARRQILRERQRVKLPTVPPAVEAPRWRVA